MKIVNYNHLAVLAVCVHTRNFTKAGRILRRRQPTITASIKVLSQAVGDPLFVPAERRGFCGREMTPTPLAEELAALTWPLLVRIHELEKEIIADGLPRH